MAQNMWNVLILAFAMVTRGIETVCEVDTVPNEYVRVQNPEGLEPELSHKYVEVNWKGWKEPYRRGVNTLDQELRLQHGIRNEEEKFYKFMENITAFTDDSRTTQRYRGLIPISDLLSMSPTENPLWMDFYLEVHAWTKEMEYIDKTCLTFRIERVEGCQQEDGGQKTYYRVSEAPEIAVLEYDERDEAKASVRVKYDAPKDDCRRKGRAKYQFAFWTKPDCKGSSACDDDKMGAIHTVNVDEGEEAGRLESVLRLDFGRTYAFQVFEVTNPVVQPSAVAEFNLRDCRNYYEDVLLHDTDYEHPKIGQIDESHISIKTKDVKWYSRQCLNSIDVVYWPLGQETGIGRIAKMPTEEDEVRIPIAKGETFVFAYKFNSIELVQGLKAVTWISQKRGKFRTTPDGGGCGEDNLPKFLDRQSINVTEADGDDEYTVDWEASAIENEECVIGFAVRIWETASKYYSGADVVARGAQTTGAGQRRVALSATSRTGDGDGRKKTMYFQVVPLAFEMDEVELRNADELDGVRISSKWTWDGKTISYQVKEQ